LDPLNDAPSPATTTSIAFEEDFTTTEINTEQPASLGSEEEDESTTGNVLEENISVDYFEDEVMITETATHRSEEETLAGVSLSETSTAEGDIEDSGSSEELNTLRPETFEERLTTTESIYEATTTAQTTTTIPDEEQQTDQPTIVEDEEEQSEFPEEQTTIEEHLTTIENIYEETATDQTTTTIPDEEQQTSQPTIIEDEEEQSEFPEEQTSAASKGDTSTEEPTTTEIANEVVELMEEEENYLSTTEEVPFENPSTMKPWTETFSPVTTDSSAEDPKTTFLDDDIITDTPAIEEEGSADTDETLIITTEVNVEDFTKGPETSTTRPEEEQSTTMRVEAKELFFTDQTPNFNGRTKEIISEESLSDQDSFEVEIQTTTSNFDEVVSTEPSEAIESNFTIDEPTPEPKMEQTIGESTSRTDQQENIRDDLTTEQPTKVIMTHMYVMQERKNGTTESNKRSNEIQVSIHPEMSSDSTSNPVDLLVATESINDNIIFDTSEIFPVKAPEEEEEEDVTEGRTKVAIVSRVEDPKSSLEKIGDHYGTSYRTEKSISRVVTEVSV